MKVQGFSVTVIKQLDTEFSCWLIICWVQSRVSGLAGVRLLRYFNHLNHRKHVIYATSCSLFLFVLNTEKFNAVINLCC